MPTRQLSGFPPADEKNCPCAVSASATRFDVITPPIGYPLPIGFAIVMMSGETADCSNPQNEDPIRPNPTCTSSAMQRPPAPRTRA